MKLLFKVKENGNLKIEKSGRLSKIEKVLLIDIVEKINMSYENELLIINDYKKVGFNMFSLNLQVQKVNKMECILKYTLLDLECENLSELTENYINTLKTINKDTIRPLNEFRVDNVMLENGISIEAQKDLYDCLYVETTKEDLEYGITEKFAKENNMHFEDIELLNKLIS